MAYFAHASALSAALVCLKGALSALSCPSPAEECLYACANSRTGT